MLQRGRHLKYLLQFPLLVFPKCEVQELVISGHFQINVLEERNKHMRASRTWRLPVPLHSVSQTILASCFQQSWRGQNFSPPTVTC